jgi:uncharacterized lipoprotein NlpE involved in copper resistance
MKKLITTLLILTFTLCGCIETGSDSGKKPEYQDVEENGNPQSDVDLEA